MKAGGAHGVRAEMRCAFPRRIYRRRALIESLFSSVKRKLSARAPGRSLPMQMRQALQTSPHSLEDVNRAK
jgi:hypothetical protein